MPSKRFPPTDPREWFRRAKLNLARSQNLVEDADYEDYCFDAQQAAEKAIKAVFIRNGLTVKRIHDLQELLTVLASAGVRVPKYLMAADRFDTFRSVHSLPRTLVAGHEGAIPVSGPDRAARS